jgi:8-oxo-dGTP diphosphatase
MSTVQETMVSMSNPSSSQGRPMRRGVVAVIVNEARLLVIRRSQAVVAPGAYCFPGGHIEPGESEPDALVREIAEEIGIIVRPIRRLWQSITAWDVHLSWWLAIADSGSVCKLNPHEVESMHWLTPEEIANLPALLPSNHEFLQALSSGQVVIEAM